MPKPMPVSGISRAGLLARALRDARATVVTCVPGAGATLVYEAWTHLAGAPVCYSFHEETAFLIAHGASLAGCRTAVLVKTHGLAKAGNAVVDALSAGTGAGFVILVFDDREGAHSDSILESGALLRGFRIPCLAPTPAGYYRAVIEAFARSETLRLPVAVRIASDTLAGRTTTAPARRQGPIPRPYPWRRNVAQHVLCPPLARYQRAVLDAKLAGRPWRRLRPPPLPRIPDGLPAAWQPVARLYAPLFEVFRTLRGEVVAGDTGISSLFAFPPYACIDLCTCMGGSLPLAIGALLAGRRSAWAVTGDFSFLAAGQLGLLEAARRGLPLKVLILDNRQAETTGGQPVPAGLLETALRGYAGHVTVIRHPHDPRAAEPVLRAASRAATLRIVVTEHFRRPSP